MSRRSADRHVILRASGNDISLTALVRRVIAGVEAIRELQKRCGVAPVVGVSSHQGRWYGPANDMRALASAACLI
jgi:hypothetical protein